MASVAEFVGIDGAGITARAPSWSVPAGVVDGDLIVAWMQVDRTTVTITPPSGWTQFYYESANNRQQIGWYRFADNEPASYSWASDPASSFMALAMFAYRGVDPTTPIDAGVATRTLSSDTPTASIITTAGDARRVVFIADWNGARTVTASSANLRGQYANGLAVNDFEQATAGSTPAHTDTLNSIATWRTYTFAIAPAPAGGNPQPLDAAIVGSSSASAMRLSVAHSLDTTINGSSNASAERVRMAHPLDTGIAATSAASALRLVIGHALATDMIGSSEASAEHVAVGHLLSAEIAGSSEIATERLIVGHVLRAAIAGASGVTVDSVTVAHALSAALAGSSLVIADLEIGHDTSLSVAISGSSHAAASRITLAHPLTAALTGDSDASAARISLAHPLSAAISGLSDAEFVRLTIAHALTVAISGRSQLAADLFVALIVPRITATIATSDLAAIIDSTHLAATIKTTDLAATLE